VDPVTLGIQTAKALAEAQSVQQILAIICGVLLAATCLLAYLQWSEAKDRRAEVKAHGEALKASEEARRVEVRELLELMTTRLAALAKDLDSEHDRNRASGHDSGADHRV
jgi:hypothetical protein